MEIFNLLVNVKRQDRKIVKSDVMLRKEGSARPFTLTSPSL